MAAPTTPTTCRICESACGLRATVADGRVTHLAPDPDHPVSRGYACVKGTRFTRIQHHPDRVLRPLVDGRPTPWPAALAALGGRLAAIRDAHGPDAVGLYAGNAAGHGLGAVLGLAALQRGLGTTRHYACLTLDNSMQFVVAEEVFGSPMATFVADYGAADVILLAGTDPLASQPSQSQSNPAGVGELRRAEAVWVVDPRRSTTARRAHTHLAPVPGTDVFWLAWLVGEVVRVRGGPPALADACAPFTLARTAVTGLAPADLRALRDRLLAAERPLVWSGLGVLLGPHGTLGWWLTVCLQGLLTGFDTPGGWRWQPGPIGLARVAPWLMSGRDPDLRSSDGRFPAILGTLAAATLCDDIRRGHLRALVVVGGDPARALPGATDALGDLDLLVSVDLFVNATGRLADAVLPAATWLERSSAGLHTGHQRRVPHLRIDPPVVPPRGEARTDWRILADLCRAAGRPLFGSRVLDAVLPSDPATALARLVRRLPRLPARLPPARLAVPEFLAALAALPDPPDGVRLVTSVRPIGSMNHWIRATPTRVTAHPDTLPAGPHVLHGAASVPVLVTADPTLRPGVVVVPFGADPNPNPLVDAVDLEPFTGQPISNGRVITVTRGAARTPAPRAPSPTTGADGRASSTASPADDGRRSDASGRPAPSGTGSVR